MSPHRPMLTAVLAAAALAGACGSGSTVATGPSGASVSTPASTAPATDVASAPPAADPQVALWARHWRHKVAAPMRFAAARLAVNALPATRGDAGASFRLTRALDTLSNCRTPFETSLAETPPAFTRARRLSLAACREFYVGASDVVAGVNSASTAMTGSGTAHVRRGLRLLRLAERVVARAVDA